MRGLRLDVASLVLLVCSSYIYTADADEILDCRCEYPREEIYTQTFSTQQLALPSLTYETIEDFVLENDILIIPNEHEACNYLQYVCDAGMARFPLWEGKCKVTQQHRKPNHLGMMGMMGMMKKKAKNSRSIALPSLKSKGMMMKKPKPVSESKGKGMMKKKQAKSTTLREGKGMMKKKAKSGSISNGKGMMMKKKTTASPSEFIGKGMMNMGTKSSDMGRSELDIQEGRMMKKKKKKMIIDNDRSQMRMMMKKNIRKLLTEAAAVQEFEQEVEYRQQAKFALPWGEQWRSVLLPGDHPYCRDRVVRDPTAPTPSLPGPVTTESPTQETSRPSLSPTGRPTMSPRVTVVRDPTPGSGPTDTVLRFFPTIAPTRVPTLRPTRFPTSSPSILPSGSPSFTPSGLPSTAPTPLPTKYPTVEPTASPTVSPTARPTPVPSRSPSQTPSEWPSALPSAWPSEWPSVLPTEGVASQEAFAETDQIWNPPASRSFTTPSAPSPSAQQSGNPKNGPAPSSNTADSRLPTDSGVAMGGDTGRARDSPARVPEPDKKEKGDKTPEEKDKEKKNKKKKKDTKEKQKAQSLFRPDMASQAWRKSQGDQTWKPQQAKTKTIFANNKA